MKLLFTKARNTRASGGDDTLGRGMESALMIAVFLGLGYLVDSWLGTRPIFMVGLVLFGAAGVFVRMKYAYDAVMVAHEEARAEAARARTVERPRENA
jgi:F0F1-type ATP synthase assembly protein I